MLAVVAAAALVVGGLGAAVSVGTNGGPTAEQSTKPAVEVQSFQKDDASKD